MRATLPAVLLAVACCAACGARTQTGTPPPASPPTSTSTTACAGTLDLTDTDTNRDTCVRVGGRVTVLLHGTDTSTWNPPTADSDALRPVTDTKGTRPVGVTAVTYTADHPGTAHVTAARAACPSGSPGTLKCALQSFTVTITIR
ncbi:hypothetical protein F0L68_04020 [Solihabitans fulvus]|uniref:Uncharacterized protein n=1 Tax=Solihabitans fulvus TaxID=1892852 RepID=A0A5B2XRL4_9PSEU|nr:hypothetical protein [Solihabitans fulvus]KAA2265745.1 hypothetical protein F0L68_04020 [Solihabitans fulvus]